jgi:hypothetical protein
MERLIKIMTRTAILGALLLLIGVAFVLQTGCVTGRRSFALPVQSHDIPPATHGKVYIAAVTDDRELRCINGA